MSEPDLLFTVRNNYYLGAFQSAIAEAADIEGLSDSEKNERDCFVYRSYIELGSYEEKVLETLQEWLSDPACSSNPMVLLTAGLVHDCEGNHVEALKACHSGATLEMMAFSVQVYLKMDRPDQAEKQLKAMTAIDEDAVLTQLTMAWVDLFLGGSKVEEAACIFQELGDKFNWTARLYNCNAICFMRMGEWVEADKALQEAFEKDAKNPDTVANLIVSGLRCGKNVSRYSNQLKTLAPHHVLAARTAQAESDFQQAAAAYAAA